MKDKAYKLLGLKTNVLELEKWILMQEENSLLKVVHSRDGDLTVSGLLNTKTKEIYIIAERQLNQ